MNSSFRSLDQIRNLNALLISVWRQHGDAEVMDDGSEVVSYNTLMRRVMALSCFIDEAAGERRGPVMLYLPCGLWAVRCLFAAWMTGRGVLPLEAVAEARRGPALHPHRRFVEPHRPHLDSLDEKPSLLITLTPLIEHAQELLMQANCSSVPTLAANEISKRMDLGHQERIRSRLQESWMEERSGLDSEEVALFTEDDSVVPGKLSHRELLVDVYSHLEELAPGGRRRFLGMTSISKPSTWSRSILSCIALGGRLSFIRFFHPQHVIDVLHRDRVDHLWMSPSHYEAFTRLLEKAPPSWDVEYWADAPPSESLQRAFKSASGCSLRWIDAPLG